MDKVLESVVDKIIESAQNDPSNPKKLNTNGNDYTAIIRAFYKEVTKKEIPPLVLAEYQKKITDIMREYNNDMGKADNKRIKSIEGVRIATGQALDKLRRPGFDKFIAMAERIKKSSKGDSGKDAQALNFDPGNLSITQVALFLYGAFLSVAGAAGAISGETESGFLTLFAGLGLTTPFLKQFGVMQKSLPPEGTPARWIVDNGGNVNDDKKNSISWKWYHLIIAPEKDGVSNGQSKRASFMVDHFDWRITRRSDFLDQISKLNSSNIKYFLGKNSKYLSLTASARLSNQEIIQLLRLVFLETGKGDKGVIRTFEDFAMTTSWLKGVWRPGLLDKFTNATSVLPWAEDDDKGKDKDGGKKKRPGNQASDDNFLSDPGQRSETYRPMPQAQLVTNNRYRSPNPAKLFNQSQVGILGNIVPDGVRVIDKYRNMPWDHIKTKPRKSIYTFYPNSEIDIIKNAFDFNHDGQVANLIDLGTFDPSIIENVNNLKKDLKMEAVKILQNKPDLGFDVPLNIGTNIEIENGFTNRNLIVDSWFKKLGIPHYPLDVDYINFDQNTIDIGFKDRTDGKGNVYNGKKIQLNRGSEIDQDAKIGIYKNGGFEETDSDTRSDVDSYLGIKSVHGLSNFQLIKFFNILGTRESSLDYGEDTNHLGFIGKYQMGARHLADLGYINKDKADFLPKTPNRDFGTEQKKLLGDSSNWNFGLSKQKFLNDHALQERIMVESLLERISHIIGTGVDINEIIDGKIKIKLNTGEIRSVSIAGALMGAHLGGAGGLDGLLRTGGNSSDGGTTVGNYIILGNLAMQ